MLTTKTIALSYHCWFKRFVAYATCSLVLIACGGGPESVTILDPNNNTDDDDLSTPISQNVDDLSQIQYKYWLREETTRKFELIMIDPQGHFFELSADKASAGPFPQCYSIARYVGNLEALGDGRFRLEDDISLSLSIINDSLLFDYDGSSNRPQADYASTTLPSFEVSQLCEIEFAAPQEGHIPVTSIETLDGAYFVSRDTEFGERVFYTVIHNGRERAYSALADTHFRADDCFSDGEEFIRNVHLGDNFFVRAAPRTFNPTVMRAYRTSEQQFLYFDQERFLRDISDIPVEEFMERACPTAEDLIESADRVTEIAQLTGFWSFPYVDRNGAEDEYYVAIDENGAWRAYDPRNDSFNEGQRCTRVSDLFGQTQAIEGGLFRHEFLNPDFGTFLSESIIILRTDNGDLLLIGFDNTGTRTLSPTSLTPQELTQSCDAIENPVPFDIKKADIARVAGYWRLISSDRELEQDGVIEITPQGFVSSFSPVENDNGQVDCFDFALDHARYFTENGGLARVYSPRGAAESVELFASESQLFITDPSTQNIVSEYVFVDDGSTITDNLCEQPPAPPAGASPVLDISGFQGQWQIAGIDQVDVELIDAQGNITRLLEFDKTRSLADRCLYPDLNYFENAVAVDENTFAFVLQNNFAQRYDVYRLGNELYYIDDQRIFTYTSSDLSQEELNARCPTVENVPDTAQPVVSIEDLQGIWDSSVAVSDNSFDQRFVLIDEEGLRSINFLDDSADQGDACYEYADTFDRIEFIEENRFRITSIDGESNIYSAFVADDRLLLANEQLTITYESTPLAVEDLTPVCEPPLSPLTDIGDIAGSWRFLIEDDELSDDLVVVKADGFIDYYLFTEDPDSAQGFCYEEFIDDESFSLLGENRYLYRTFAGEEFEVLMFANDSRFLVEFEEFLPDTYIREDLRQEDIPICSP